MQNKYKSIFHQQRKEISRKLRKILPSVTDDNISEKIIYEKRLKIAWYKNFKNAAPGEDLIHEWMQETEEKYIKVYNKVKIDGRSGLIIKDSKIAWGSTDYPKRERTPLLFKTVTKKIKHIPTAISIHHAYDDNYYHFITITTPKIKLIEEAKIDANIPLIISSKLAVKKFFLDAVELGLLCGRDFIVQDINESVFIDQLYTVKAFEYEVDDMNWLCDRLGSTIDENTKNSIYIHRGANSANGRQFRNQKDLNKVIESYNIEFYDPAEHSLKHQIKTFANAKTIIGAHGAGFTNIIFRKSNPTSIIEMLNPSWCAPHYFLLSAQRNFNYTWLMNMNESNHKKATAEADIEGLIKAIDKLNCSN